MTDINRGELGEFRPDNPEKSEELKPHLFTVEGRELSPADLALINRLRKEEFGSESLIDPDPSNEDWNKLYFLVKEAERLLAFGRLHDVKVTFQNQVYDALGIATIIAVVKGEGHGSQLMAGMRTHIEQAAKTGFGFCNKNTSPFYQKNGFQIMTDGVARFEHPTPSRFPEGDVLYLSGQDRLIEKMLEQPSEVAYISRPQW